MWFSDFSNGRLSRALVFHVWGPGFDLWHHQLNDLCSSFQRMILTTQKADFPSSTVTCITVIVWWKKLTVLVSGYTWQCLGTTLPAFGPLSCLWPSLCRKPKSPKVQGPEPITGCRRTALCGSNGENRQNLYLKRLDDLTFHSSHIGVREKMNYTELANLKNKNS